MAPGAPELAGGVRGGMTDRERLLDELRPVAFAIAYRMLGSVSEAEDVVQEVLLRVLQALEGGEQIASSHAFVATVTSRLAINELRSARARRERYIGEWLPSRSSPPATMTPRSRPRWPTRYRWRSGAPADGLGDDHRVPATVVFTDLVSSTPMVAKLGDGRCESCSTPRRTHRRAHIAFPRSTVDRTGDGLLATSTGLPRGALRATICEEVHPFGLDAPAGVHAGEIELRGEHVGGITIHLAVRVMSVAGSGEVVVSRTVKDLTGGIRPHVHRSRYPQAQRESQSRGSCSR